MKSQKYIKCLQQTGDFYKWKEIALLVIQGDEIEGSIGCDTSRIANRRVSNQRVLPALKPLPN